ncbi:unnamed protein product, partial [Thlaspi arvense]
HKISPNVISLPFLDNMVKLLMSISSETRLLENPRVLRFLHKKIKIPLLLLVNNLNEPQALGQTITTNTFSKETRMKRRKAEQGGTCCMKNLEPVSSHADGTTPVLASCSGDNTVGIWGS